MNICISTIHLNSPISFISSFHHPPPPHNAVFELDVQYKCFKMSKLHNLWLFTYIENDNI